MGSVSCESRMPWLYEPNRKHKWNVPRAEFVEGPGGEIIGKCPSNLAIAQAAALLNEDCAVTYSPPGWSHDFPERVYNIHNGVLYRATRTVGGRSYHGFPEHPQRARRLPRAVKDQLLELARQKGCEAEVRKWLRGK